MRTLPKSTQPDRDGREDCSRRRSPEIATVVSGMLRALPLCAPVLVAVPPAIAQSTAVAPLSADIPAQPLGEALDAFASQTGLQVVYVSGILRKQKSRAAPAGLGPREALARMLQGTGLRYEFLTPQSVRILAIAPPERKSGSGDEQDEVFITGTRLPTANEISISPISTVSAVEFRQTGLTRVEDVLDKLPMFTASTDAAVNNSADGTAALNLRGLGTQRTLVLIDGMRLGPGSTDGRNWSDINQIPAALIDHVDVLTGGASAVYGADAVAGVVNFILDTHYQGVRVDASYHLDHHRNSARDAVASLVSAADDALPPGSVDAAAGESASAVMGTNFAHGGGNVTGYVTYDKQAGVLQSQFDYSACALTPPVTPLPACGGSDTSRGGEFAVLGNGGLVIDDTVDPKTGVFRPFAAGDVYNFAPENYYQTPSERWTGGMFLKYGFGPRASVYARVMYMRNSMMAQLAPSGAFGMSAFIPCADPLLTAQEVATLCTPATLAANGGDYEIYNGVSYPGLDLYVLRRNVEGGNRIDTFTNTALRTVLGVKGSLTDGWAYKAYLQRNSLRIDDSEENDFGSPQITQALNVLPGLSGPVCGGRTGAAFTADPTCVPWNIWVPGAVTSASLAFLHVPSFTTGRLTGEVVSGSVTGDLARYGAKLPAAELGLELSFGAEWRKEQTSFMPNAEQQQGYVEGESNPVIPIAGALTVKELFTEMLLPLATHRKFAEDLSVDGGYRYSAYSRGFKTNAYRLGLQWAPVRAARLRGSYQRAVRAPNISELFSLQFVNNSGFTVDPCAGTPTASVAACELTGVKAGQYGHIVPSPFGTYNSLTGGNPSLRPEEADTYTAGLVLQPAGVRDLTLSIDYFDIHIEGVIAAIGADTVMRDCLASVDDPAQAGRFCPLIHRDAQGSLGAGGSGYVSDLLVNEGELATRGIDVTGGYRLPLPPAGSLSITIAGTHVQSLQTTPVSGFGSYDCAGYFGTACGVVTPKWRHVLSANWSTPWRGIGLGVRWRYLGASESAQTSASSFLSGTTYLPLARIPAYNYFDLNGVINLSRNLTLQLGVNNLADKAPPLVVGNDCFGTAGGLCNGNTFPGVYDALGRYLFGNLSAQW